ncbi:hypothetical protein [Sphingopyxis fribergensis]|nr:hypothetical protein [Sphingopyxis fribergensis]
MNREKRARIMAWVGSEILPHEADVRAWLRRTLNPEDLEDVIQETYCQIASLNDVGHTLCIFRDGWCLSMPRGEDFADTDI